MRRQRSRRESNTASLIASFAECLERFEATQAFGGRSLWFHERAVERRRAALDAIIDTIRTPRRRSGNNAR